MAKTRKHSKVDKQDAPPRSQPSLSHSNGRPFVKGFGRWLAAPPHPYPALASLTARNRYALGARVQSVSRARRRVGPGCFNAERDRILFHYVSENLVRKAGRGHFHLGPKLRMRSDMHWQSLDIRLCRSHAAGQGRPGRLPSPPPPGDSAGGRNLFRGRGQCVHGSKHVKPASARTTQRTQAADREAHLRALQRQCKLQCTGKLSLHLLCHACMYAH